MIESKANSKVKKLVALSSKKGRREHKQYLIEGIHMVSEAIKYGVQLTEVFVAESKKSAILPTL